MKFFLLVSSSLALLSTLVFGQPKTNDDDKTGADSYQRMVSSLKKFTGTIYSHLATTYPNDNLAFSSMSISFAFSLVSLGAKPDTRSQILEALGFDLSKVSDEDIYNGFHHLLKNFNQSKRDLLLNIANALFVDKELKLLQSYEDKAKALYQSEVISTDFQKPEEAKKQINDHVEEKTDGMIKEFVSQLDVNTVLVLINTIIFKGNWKDGFKEKNTREKDFHVDEKTIVKVPMMRKEGKYPVAFIPENDCTVVKIPYTDNFSAIFIIPKKGKLQDVENIFAGQMETWIGKMKERKIEVYIPKFSVSKKYDLKKELSPIGFSHMFSNNADLTGIADDPRLKVSQATHEAVVEVNEKGTKAAAATSIGIVATSLVIYPKVEANCPFIMSIVKDDDNTPIFTIRVKNPTL